MQQFAFDLFLAGVCFIVWQRGGKPERIAAALFVIAGFGSWIFVGKGSSIFSSTEWGLFAIDFCLFLGLVALALSVDRYWPMWLASLQFVSVWMHPAFGVSETKMAYAYAVASIIWSYPMLLILALGSLRHHARTHARVLP
jgi:hypothetical protein